MLTLAADWTVGGHEELVDIRAHDGELFQTFQQGGVRLGGRVEPAVDVGESSEFAVRETRAVLEVPLS